MDWMCFHTTMGDVREQLSEYSQVAKEKVEAGLETVYSQVLAQPKTTLVLLVILSAYLGNIGTNFQDQIVDDVEIFLPEGAESTELLIEVREEWSTDIGFIYIKTPNAFDPEIYKDDYNISNVDILHEISWIEGDDEKSSSPGLKKNGIDWHKEDHGKEDGVLWIISMPQIIKEINSSDGRFNNAMCGNTGERLTANLIDCDLLSQGQNGGLYAIPDEQQRVDEIINQSNGSLSRLVNDTNGDGIWDTTYVMIGMISENQINQTGKWENYKEFFSHVNDIIAEENRPQEYRVTEMTQTGLSKILKTFLMQYILTS